MKLSVYPRGVSDDDFRKLLCWIQYFERYPSKESKSGCRSNFDETFLFNASVKIKTVLHNETGGRIMPKNWKSKASHRMISDGHLPS